MAEWKAMDVLPPKNGMYLVTIADRNHPEVWVGFVSFRDGEWRHTIYQKNIAWTEPPEPFPCDPNEYVDGEV